MPDLGRLLLVLALARPELEAQSHREELRMARPYPYPCPYLAVPCHRPPFASNALVVTEREQPVQPHTTPAAVVGTAQLGLQTPWARCDQHEASADATWRSATHIVESERSSARSRTPAV